jgi:1-acyl-sn-glycerol-3-phosphate acyltransferase
MLRSQYRRIEVEGAERVPGEGPVLLVANHFSSIVDSLALLVASPRPISFLAKAPLFESFFLGPFLRALDAVPVFRPQDAAVNEGRGARANLEVFEAVSARLARGECLAVFPEGVSQPQPRLMPVRTGAARILLATERPVTVVPAGLVYEHPRGGRRGDLLVRFGEPFSSRDLAEGASRRQAIADLTRRVERSLKTLLAEADSAGELEAIRTLRVVYDQERGTPPPRRLAERHRRDRRMAQWVDALRERAPKEVEALRAETDAYLRALDLAGLPPEAIDARYTPGRVLRFVTTQLPLWALVGPLAFVASLVTWPVRQGGDLLALRLFGRGEDVRAFCRIAGVSMVLVLATAAAGLGVGIAAGALWGLLAAIALPLLLWLHVAWRDRAHGIRARVRAFFLLAGGPLRRELRAQRRALHDRTLRAGAHLAAASGGRSEPGAVVPG